MSDISTYYSQSVSTYASGAAAVGSSGASPVSFMDLVSANTNAAQDTNSQNNAVSTTAYSGNTLASSVKSKSDYSAHQAKNSTATDQRAKADHADRKQAADRSAKADQAKTSSSSETNAGNDAAETSASSDDADVTLDPDAVQTVIAELTEALKTGQVTGADGQTVKLDAAAMKKLQATLDTLMKGMPAGSKVLALQVSGAQLKDALGQLTADGSQVGSNDQNLIATGLTPAQLTKLVQILAQDANASGQASGSDAAPTDGDPLEAILSGIIKIVPDENKASADLSNDNVFIPKAVLIDGGKKQDDGTGSADALAAALTGLTAAAQPQTIATGSGSTGAAGSGGSDAQTDGEIVADAAKAGKGLQEMIDGMQAFKARVADEKAGPAPSGKEDAGSKFADELKATALNSSVEKTSDAIGSLSDLGDDISSLFPEGSSWSGDTTGLAGLSNTQVTGPAQLTSLVTQAQTATQPHAATQVVAATLTRGVQSGESKSLTLKLDPPELGRIEVHMVFTDDKSVKTHMVFEKPETMLMMQRDSHVLQHAMQDSGMNADGSSLSFELASQNHSFGSNSGSGGNGGHSSGGTAGGVDDASGGVIESTMTWYVDGATGQQHYNLLV